LRDFDQPGLDGVGQAEVAHNPRKNRIRRRAGAANEIRGRRQIDAEIDPSQLVDPVEAVHPDGRLFDEVVLVFLPVVLAFVLVIRRPLKPVGVVCFVVDDEDVLLAADLAAKDAVDQRRVALDVAHRLDFDLFEIALAVAILVENGQ
jgi:hypothetical protein